MATAGMDLCVAYDVAGKYAKVVDLAPRILAFLEEAGREREVVGAGVNAYAFTLCYSGYGLGYLGDFQAGKAILDKAVSFALQMDDKTNLVNIEIRYGFQLALKGDGPGAAEHYRSAIRFCEEVKFHSLLGLAWTGLGWAYHLMGELETAREYTEKGLKAQRDAGFPYILFFHFWHLGWVSLDLADLQAAQEHLEQARRLSQQHHEGFWEALCQIWLGRALARADPSQAQQAEEHIRQGIQMAEGLKLRPAASHGYHFLGELYAARGEREKALENLKKAIGMYQEMGMEYWLAETRKVLAEL
jgi:tetratricopeptide (TPR) repeat protein